MKKLTAAALAALMLLSAAGCAKDDKTIDTTTATTATTVPETTETTVTTAETTEAPVDLDALLEGYTVYDVTIEWSSYIAPFEELEVLDYSEKPEKVALRFTDVEGLIILLEFKPEYHNHKVAGIVYGNNIVTCATPLDYRARAFTVLKASETIAVYSDYGSDYYFLGEKGCISLPPYIEEGEVSARIGVFLSSDTGEIICNYTNVLFCDIHAIGAELCDTYNSENDLYMKHGRIVTTGGTPELEERGTETIGEWYQSGDFPYGKIRDKYGFETLKDMTKRFSHPEGYQEFIKIYEEIERGTNDN